MISVLFNPEMVSQGTAWLIAFQNAIITYFGLLAVIYKSRTDAKLAWMLFGNKWGLAEVDD